MSQAATVVSTPRHLRDKEMILSLQASGNYTTGGDTVNLTTLLNPSYLGDANIGYPGNIKIWEVINCPAGFKCKLIPGTNLTNWKLKVMVTGAALSGEFAELAAGAYPADFLADVTTIRLVGPKGQM